MHAGTCIPEPTEFVHPTRQHMTARRYWRDLLSATLRVQSGSSGAPLPVELGWSIPRRFSKRRDADAEQRKIWYSRARVKQQVWPGQVRSADGVFIQIRLPGLPGLHVANPRIDKRSRLRRLASLSQPELVSDESPVRVKLVVTNARGEELDTAFVDDRDPRSLVAEPAI